MLYLVATPIGNLQDISYRAVETLKACDYILCEDTRHSRVLLNHYDIQKPLVSFHKFSEASKENEVIQDLQNGRIIALISDAGTPGIADPGMKLVQACHEHRLPVTAIPGPSAAITALVLSGFDTSRFQFFGFLPKKKEALSQTLKEILSYPGTTIAYEAPGRLLDTLSEIVSIDKDRILCVARELTKKYEQISQGTAFQLKQLWKSKAVKGEIVLLFSGKGAQDIDWTALSPEEHVAFIEKTYSLTRQEAIRMAAQMRGVPKRDIYNAIHRESDF